MEFKNLIEGNEEKIRMELKESVKNQEYFNSINEWLTPETQSKLLPIHKDMVIEGDLDISDLKNVQTFFHLAENINIKGDLKYSPDFNNFPSNLTCKNKEEFILYSAFKKNPNNLIKFIETLLTMDQSKADKLLGLVEKFFSDFFLTKYSFDKSDLPLIQFSAKHFPQNKITINGNLILYGCTSLTSLPANLKVGGDLVLEGCTSLTSLPAGLTVGVGLSLWGCKSLTSLPEGLIVGGNLNLERCTSLKSLPAGLTVGGSLNLWGCTSLASLPEGLKVGGSLDLNGCTSLTSLPEGLNVGGNLDLNGCKSLTSLPADLKVGVDIYR